MSAALSIFTAPFTSAHTSLSPSARSLPKQQAHHSRVGPHLSTRLGFRHCTNVTLGTHPSVKSPQMLITRKFSGDWDSPGFRGQQAEPPPGSTLDDSWLGVRRLPQNRRQTRPLWSCCPTLAP